MRLSRLLRRNLAYFWRTNLAVVLGAGTATSVLAGALVVGESVRESLRELVLRRLGNASYLITANRMFREDLAADLAESPAFREGFDAGAPIIHLTGIVTHESSGRRAYQVQVYGVDDRFWRFHGVEQRRGPEGRDAFLSESLAAELGARSEETLLLRIEKQASVPREFLFGEREDSGRTIRLSCREILPPSLLGDFSLEPSQGSVRSIFVPLKRLQSDLDQTRRANAILIASSREENLEVPLLSLLRETCTIDDLGLKLRVPERKNLASLESDRVILEEPAIDAGREAAAAAGMRVSGLYSYLANTIRFRDRAIPYSIVTAADLGAGSLVQYALHASVASNGEPIWLNSWAARDLGARPGEKIGLEYYLWGDGARLESASAEFTLAGIVDLEGKNADSHFAPEFPGITDAERLGDWNPPFPIDLRRIRPKDEEYWDLYRTTPKAFIRLARGQELWKSRFGSLTSLRVAPGGESPHGADFERFRSELRARMEPASAGFHVDAVRARGEDASRGSTDFGEYFLYFSFFLIIAAVFLAALFFRLGIEQRVREIGLLTAQGFSRSDVRRIFLLEGMLLAAAGSLLGTMASLGYGKLLVLGLKTWWVGAIGAPFLELHLSPAPLLASAPAGIAMALASVALTLGGLRQTSPRAMLSGTLEPPGSRRRKVRALKLIAAAAAVGGVTLLLVSWMGVVDEVAGFFGSGILLLSAILSLIGLGFRREGSRLPSEPGWRSLLMLGARNADHRPGRSVLCVALIAGATFIIVSVEAFRHDPSRISPARESGTGGFPLMAESVLPMIQDLGRREALDGLPLSSGQVESLRAARIVSLRMRRGEDASCLNLYSPREPRILGVPPALLRERRFAFRASAARNAEARENAWLLLESSESDGAVPAIADANTIQYVLHKELGDEVVISPAGGAPVRLRLVAALRDSIFQSEILVSEANFLRHFPEQEGYRFFLLDLPPENVAEASASLEEGLSDYGFDVTSTSERLAAYHGVENTYLSIFQSLGGLGLVLGTFGLGTVLLRNVLERRRELALLRAVGYTRGSLAAIVVSENLVLLVLGLATGVLGALVAIFPALAARGGAVSLGALASLLASVLLAGLTASILAVIAALRAPLLSSLRSE